MGPLSPFRVPTLDLWPPAHIRRRLHLACFSPQPRPVAPCCRLALAPMQGLLLREPVAASPSASPPPWSSCSADPCRRLAPPQIHVATTALAPSSAWIHGAAAAGGWSGGSAWASPAPTCLDAAAEYAWASLAPAHLDVAAEWT